MKTKTIKVLRANRPVYESYIKRSADGTVKKVILWEHFTKQLLEDTNIRKINGVLVDTNNNIVKKADFVEYIYAAVRNIEDKLVNQIAKTIEGSAADKIAYPNKDYIVLANGRYEVKTGLFEPGKFDSINKVPWNYVEGAKSPLGSEIFERYTGTNKGFDTQVFEATGLMMAQEKDYHFKKSIFFNGIANSGKSFLFEQIIQPTIGDNNIGLIEFGEIDEKEIASLINKTAGYDSDMYKGKMSDKSIGKFKKVVGDTKLKAKLLYKDSFEFVNYATIWINCNGLPRIIDRGSGDSVKERVHVIQATVNMKKEHHDPHIAGKVNAVRQEVSEWLLFNSLHALTNAIKRGSLTVTKASQETIDIEINNADAVTRFIRHYTFSHHSTTLSSIYQDYKNTFLQGGDNIGELEVGKHSFNATLRDMSVEKNIRIFLSGGVTKVQKNDESDPFVRTIHGDLIRQSDLDADMEQRISSSQEELEYIRKNQKEVNNG